MATKDYLDPRWQKVRLRIMERDSFECSACGDKESTLHVHHKKYDKGKRIWETEDKDLITLCENCHERVEQFVQSMRMIGDTIIFVENISFEPVLISDCYHDLMTIAKSDNDIAVLIAKSFADLTTFYTRMFVNHRHERLMRETA